MTKMCSLAMRLANPIPWSFNASSKVLKANEALLAGEATSPRFEALKTAPAYVLAMPDSFRRALRERFAAARVVDAI
jgi:hypothetical protein